MIAMPSPRLVPLARHAQSRALVEPVRGAWVRFTLVRLALGCSVFAGGACSTGSADPAKDVTASSSDGAPSSSEASTASIPEPPSSSGAQASGSDSPLSPAVSDSPAADTGTAEAEASTMGTGPGTSTATPGVTTSPVGDAPRDDATDPLSPVTEGAGGASSTDAAPSAGGAANGEQPAGAGDQGSPDDSSTDDSSTDDSNADDSSPDDSSTDDSSTDDSSTDDSNADDSSTDDSNSDDSSSGGDDAMSEDDSCPGSGDVRYAFNDLAAWPADAVEKITPALDEAIRYYNCYSNLSHSLTINYKPGVPTAEANVDGWISFGSDRNYMVVATVMHEIGHTMGVGFYPWAELLSDGRWTGNHVNELLASIPAEERDADYGMRDYITADGQHFWPYGLNYADEHESEWSLINHVRIVDAMNRDKADYLAR